MAKKEWNLGGFKGDKIPKMYKLSDENLRTFIPEVNPNLPPIVPVGQQLKEALESVYAELSRVTGELTKANQQAEQAEKRAIGAEIETTKANRRTYWLSGLFFIVPFIFSVWTYSQSQSEKTTVAELQTTLQSLSKEVQTLKGDIAKAKIKPRPVKAPLRTIEVTNSKKP